MTRTEDEALLQSPTRPDFLDSDPWRSLRILSEFVEGFDALAEVGPAVSVFGSARMDEPTTRCTPWLATSGGCWRGRLFAVITRGGPGIMEAANRGCQEGGKLSIGCNIELPRSRASTRTSTSASSSAISSPARSCS